MHIGKQTSTTKQKKNGMQVSRSFGAPGCCVPDLHRSRQGLQGRRRSALPPRFEEPARTYLLESEQLRAGLRCWFGPPGRPASVLGTFFPRPCIPSLCTLCCLPCSVVVVVALPVLGGICASRPSLPRRLGGIGGVSSRGVRELPDTFIYCGVG